MRLSEGRFGKVFVNKVKVELIRNAEELPNIIHALGTGHSTEDFLTWKLQYRGCQDTAMAGVQPLMRPDSVLFKVSPCPFQVDMSDRSTRSIDMGDFRGSAQ